MNTDEIGTVLIPILTFVTGYLLSYLEKLYSFLRETRNLRKIIWKELDENYRLLAKLRPEVGQVDPRLVPAMARVARRLKFDVYNAYLSEFHRLSAKQVDAVYDAYGALSLAKETADEFQRLIYGKDVVPDTRQREAVISLVLSLDNALGCVKAAADTFPKGENKKPHVKEAETLAKMVEALEKEHQHPNNGSG